MGEPVRVAVRTLGCKVNQVESEDVANDLLGRGAIITSEPEADVVVVNTCTVTAEADAKARKAVRHALHLESAPVVVVTGCLAAVDRAALEALGERVVVEADKTEVARRVAGLLVPSAALTRPPTFAPAPSTLRVRTRAFVKVQDGCDCACTYCIVPAARGVPRSEPLEGISRRVEALKAAGTREVVLTGINLGRYEHRGRDLAVLIEAIAETGVERIRLSSIEPLELTDRLLSVLASVPAVCEHLHVPLQSGSDRVLSAMGRGYSAAQFAERIEAARAALPGLSVSTDVIAGFPGEHEGDHETTEAFLETVGFSRLHVFRFSPRAGTTAAALPDQVPSSLRSARARRVRDLDARLRRRFAESRLGCEAELLVEAETSASGGTGLEVTGTTREYLRVSVPVVAGHGYDVAVGDIVRCELLSADAGGVVRGGLLGVAR